MRTQDNNLEMFIYIFVFHCVTFYIYEKILQDNLQSFEPFYSSVLILDLRIQQTKRPHPKKREQLLNRTLRRSPQKNGKKPGKAMTLQWVQFYSLQYFLVMRLQFLFDTAVLLMSLLWYTQSHPGALNISQTGSPLEQREEKRGGRPPKKRPTHFITFRANTPAILSCFQQLQKEITSLLPSSAPHWQTSSGLHVTMCLLVLRSPAEVDAAAEILRQFAHLDRNCPVSLNFPVKLKHFNGRVLYLSPQPQLRLQQLNSGLQEAYREKGLLHRDSYNPRYHLTLAKVVDGEVDRIFDGVGDLKVGKGLNFGRLPVNTLHLCVIGGFTDGFYETVCTVTLRW